VFFRSPSFRRKASPFYGDCLWQACVKVRDGTVFFALAQVVARSGSRGGLAVRVSRTLATKLPTRVRILGVAIFSRVDSKRSEAAL